MTAFSQELAPEAAPVSGHLRHHADAELEADARLPGSVLPFYVLITRKSRQLRLESGMK